MAKIRVDADVSGIEESLSRLKRKAEDVNKSLGSGKVSIDTGTATKSLADLSKATQSLRDGLEKAKAAGVDLSKVDMAGIEKAISDAARASDRMADAMSRSGGSSRKTVDEVRNRIRAEDEAHKRQMSQMREFQREYEKLQKSGARGTRFLRGMGFDDFAGGGWKSYSVNHSEAARYRDEVFARIGYTQTGGAAFNPATGGIVQSALRGVGAAIPSFGVGGSMLGQGISAARAAEGGMLSAGGLGALARGTGYGALAYGAYKLVSGGFDKYDSAKSELQQYSELRRSLGLTVKDFDYLRDSVNDLSKDLGLSNNEMAGLARSYARGASLPSGAFEIGSSVRTGALMSRGLGIDAQTGVGFLASMKHLGVINDEQGNRRLAMLIGEAVGKGEFNSRVEDLMGAVTDFASNAARSGLNSPNVAGFTSMLASMSGLGLAGWKGDPRAAAMAFGQADSAFRSGGGFGEASQNFLLSVFQKRFSGFTALDQSALQEQGLFGSASAAFGRDSAAYRFAQSRGDVAQMARYESWAGAGNTSLIDMVMSDLEKRHGGNSRAMQMELSGLFGLSSTHSQALYLAHKSNGGLTGLTNMLTESGLDPSNIDATKLGAFASLANAKRPELMRQARYLSGLGLSGRDRADLTGAMSGSDEALRSAVVRLSAQYDTEKDTGEKSLELQAQMSNMMQNLVANLVPAVVTIKDGIVALVRRFMPESDFIKNYDQQMGALGIAPVGATSETPTMTKYSLLDRFKSDKSLIKSKIVNQALIAGIPPEVMLGLADVESGFRHDALGQQITNPKSMHYGDRAAGVFQYMSKSYRGKNRLDADENIKLAAEDLKRIYKKTGSWELAVAAWQAGENNPDILAGRIPDVSDGLKSNRAYVDAVMGKSRIYANELGRVPAGSSASGGSQSITVNGQFTLNDPRGNPLAAPVVLDTRHSSGNPQPVGR